MKERIYIAGPMTGHPEYNFPTFEAASKLYRDAGWAVHNPASSFDGALDLPYEMYMKAALGLLIQSDAIALLPGWRESRGAAMEALCAQNMGLDFYRGDRIQRIVQVDKLGIVGGTFRGATTPKSLASRLEPVVEALPAGGITADDVRAQAVALGLLDDEIGPHIVAAGITRSLRAGGYETTGQFTYSPRSNRPTSIWQRG